MTPASIRTNNPGAQWFGPIAQAFGATGQEDLADGNNAAMFPDPQSGAAAQFALLKKSYSGKTLDEAIKKWSGGNSSPDYTNFITSKTGLAPTTVLTPDLLASPQGLALAKAQAHWEAGKPFPMSDEDWASAQSKVFGNNNTPLAQATSADDAGIPGNATPTGYTAPVKPSGVADAVGGIGNSLQEAGAWLMSPSNPGGAAALLASVNAKRAANKPQFGVIGQDSFGSNKYGFINPNTGTIVAIGADGKVIPSSGSTDTGVGTTIDSIAQARLDGKDPYSAVPSDMKNYVQALVEGRALPQNMARGPIRTRLMAMAQAVDPSIDETTYGKRVEYQKHLTSDSLTTPGGQKTSLGTNFEHLADMSDKLVALDNAGTDSSFPLSSQAVHAYNATNNSAGSRSKLVKAVEDAAQRSADEQGKLFSGNQGGGVEERRAARARYNGNLMPSESAAALETDLGLLKGRAANLQQQADDIMGSGKVQFLDKPQQAAIARINENLAKLKGVTKTIGSPGTNTENRPSLDSIF